MNSPKDLPAEPSPLLEGRPAATWLREHRDELVELALDALADQDGTVPEPGRRHDPELRWIIAYNVDAFVRALERGNTNVQEDDVADLVASAARRAGEGEPVEHLLRDYQIGMDATWQAVARRCPPADQASLIQLTVSMHAYLRQVTTLVVRGFQHEAARIHTGERDTRYALYSALLTGEHPGTAAGLAGITLPEQYLVLSLRLGPGASPDEPGRAPEITRHRRANAVRRVLADHAGDDALALIQDPAATALIPLPPGLGNDLKAYLGDLTRRLSALVSAPVHAAAATAAPDAVPEARAQSEEILQIALATGQPPGAYVLDDVVITYQLTRPGPGRDLLLQRLRPIDDHPEWEATLRAYLEHGFDRKATAAHLNLHPNSVDYRLGRIAHLCGLDAADPAQRLTAFAALHARDRVTYSEREAAGRAVSG
ncbi:PucR family transcriptional regulator [Streptomyces microflavus]|uniref:PucR family transcriptional regulator n=1 Tax=Streptomyces microflavus TaxID=1919 RepID=UPI00369BE88F